MSPELEEKILRFTRKMRKVTEIDLSRLEEEWAKHPRMVGDAADLHVLAKQELLLAKADLEMTEADVKRRIRKNPTKYGVEKATDKPVEEATVLHPKYQEVSRAVIRIQYVVDKLAGVLNMLEHRKKSLEGAVSLHGQQYFAKPRVPPDAAAKFRDGVERGSFRRRKKPK